MINLMHGDCLELMKTIPDNSIDMVLTDPPYGTTACKWDTVIDFELMWKELKRITKDNGAICLFGCEPFSSVLRMSNIKMFKYDWIWHKDRPSGALNAKKMPMKNSENISVFYKKPPLFNRIFEPRIQNEESRNRLKYKMSGKVSQAEVYGKIEDVENKKYDENLRNPTTVKFFKCPPNAKGKLHPTQKPVDLLEYLIRSYTIENETVLDFTMGSGSTGVACKNLNRKFIGIELDDKYFEIAKKRIQGE